MEAKKVRQVLGDYQERLADLGAEPVKAENHDKFFFELEKEEILNHLFYMCQKACEFVDENRMEKAMRWLGFIQGAMWALNVHTIESMKEHNRPDLSEGSE